MNIIRNSEWIVKKIGLKRVKKKKAETQTRVSVVSAQSKRALNMERNKTPEKGPKKKKKNINKVASELVQKMTRVYIYILVS